MSLVLACDLGGSSFRAALVDGDGRIRHLATIATAADATETDPELWWSMLQQATATLAAEAGGAFDAIAAIAISGFTRSQVFLDTDDRVLRPALTFRDTRADRWLPDIRAALPADHPELPQINAYHPIARLGWLARAEPEAARALAAVIEPKDFLNLRLTGIRAIDRVGSARLLAAGPAMLEALGFPGRLLPAALEPTAIMGRVLPDLPAALSRLAGRPVVAMANDSWAAVLGLGALRPGVAYNLSGTTEVLGILSPTAALAEGLLTIDWGGGLHQIGGPSQAGADTLVWLLGLLGRTGAVGPALDALLAGPRQPQPLLFLPHLQGERTPYWDPALRGAFIGLNRQHGPTDCAHAVLEGSFLNRLVLERAEAAVAAPVSEIRFGGGGAASDAWCQIKADICERDIVLVDGAEAGLRGAAIAAFTALGRFAELATAQDALVRVRRRFHPRAAAVPAYRQLYALFRRAEATLAPLSRTLAAMGDGAVTALLERYGTALAGLLLIAFFMLFAPNFATPLNLLNVLKDTSFLAILSLGFALALATGELDLSVAELASLCAVISGGLIQHGTPTALAVAAALAAGAALGGFNGFGVTVLRVPSLIVTLGTAAIARGVTFMITQGIGFVGRWPQSFTGLARGTTVAVPNLVWFLAGATVFTYLLLKWTRTGAHMTATGEADEAARLAGIATARMKRLGLTLSGLFAAVTAVLLAANLSSASPNMAGDYFLYAIAAVLLGMTMFEPGRPNVPGTVFAALVLKVLGNGLVLLGTAYYVQDIVLGAIIIGSVAASSSMVKKIAFKV